MTTLTYDNVFEALFDKDQSETLKNKADLMIDIRDAMKKNGYSVREAAKAFKLPEHKIQAVADCNFNLFIK